MCSRSRSRSRYTGTSVMSRNVCYTVRSHVLSLHALTLWNTIILSFQIQYQAAVYILEWATPSLTVWYYVILSEEAIPSPENSGNPSGGQSGSVEFAGQGGSADLFSSAEDWSDKAPKINGAQCRLQSLTGSALPMARLKICLARSAVLIRLFEHR